MYVYSFVQFILPTRRYLILPLPLYLLLILFRMNLRNQHAHTPSELQCVEVIDHTYMW